MRRSSDSSSHPTVDETFNARIPSHIQQVIRDWKQGAVPDALAFLNAHESVRANTDLVVELAYEEYCLRKQRGEQLDPQEFCRRFPFAIRSLTRRIETDEYLRQYAAHLFVDDFGWPQPGDPLLDFRVVAPIASGGFARVYLCAERGVGDRQVVVKVARRGAFEADTMGRLNHPNIMPVLSTRTDERTGMSCLCMPFVGRSTLHHVIDMAYFRSFPSRAAVILEASRNSMQRGDRWQYVTPPVRINPKSSFATGALQVAVQISTALQHAHEEGVIHGDLKASNVVMSVGGTPMLVDFNLSHTSDSDLLSTGGTLPFMAPEKIRAGMFGEDSDDQVDTRSDIYSFGATLYELMTGQLPFLPARDGVTVSTVSGRMLASQAEGARAVNEINPAVNAGLANLIARCLAFDPADRPPSMDQVTDRLRRELAASKRLYRFLRHRRRMLLTVAGVGGGALIAATPLRMLRPPARERHYYSGIRHFEESDYVAAMDSFGNAIQSDDQFFEAYFARVCAALHARERDQFAVPLDAIERDLQAAGALRSDPRVYVAHSIVYLANHDFATAASSMELAIHQGVQSAEVWNNLGYAYTQLSLSIVANESVQDDLMVKADDSLRMALECNNELMEAHWNLAVLELTRYRTSGRSHIPNRGLDSVRKVVRNGRDAATFFFAAQLSGVIAEHKNDVSLRNECLGYLENAFLLGLDLNSNTLFESHPFSQISDDPRVLKLRQSAAPSRPQTTANRIVLPSGILSPTRQ